MRILPACWTAPSGLPGKPGGGSRNFLRPCMYVVPKKSVLYKTYIHPNRIRPLSWPGNSWRLWTGAYWTGQRVQDINAFIEQHGALNVLYAIWCSQGKRIENPPAFVTWWLRQGHEAPADWLPAELRTQEDPEPVPAAQPVPESTEAPETPAALQTAASRSSWPM